MAKYGVRAARSDNFTDLATARAYAADHFNAANAAPLVIKADGLAAGKGVVIAHNLTEAETALAAFMHDKSLGDAGTAVLLEEFLEGKEVSVLAAVSVTGGQGCILPFIGARDHKRRFEGAQGPNTGGMGSIAPVPDFSPAAQSDFMQSILEPTLKGIKAEGLDYRGFIFFGVMVRDNQCYLLEYNVRLGDPETQAVLPLMDFDLVDLCSAILAGRDFPLAWKQGAVCAPVAVADGYPGPYRKGDAIAIDAAALAKTGAKVFVSGAAGGTQGSPLQTSGGRVLTVSAFGADADEAYANAYRGFEAIRFDGMGFRRDIGREKGL
jgi:phosphoribosylamine--glycine ligase